MLGHFLKNSLLHIKWEFRIVWSELLLNTKSSISSISGWGIHALTVIFKCSYMWFMLSPIQQNNWRAVLEKASIKHISQANKQQVGWVLIFLFKMFYCSVWLLWTYLIFCKFTMLILEINCSPTSEFICQKILNFSYI